ncbi:hypothetical protein [Bacillus sp. M6-12]|uniref:hypothetical protein n=1 Tax=Bacillus sp. M6-12 TaxID=2054166 RepID=UPI0011588C14|nr:hypothetical protein [Bacillus sp. M6-12]
MTLAFHKEIVKLLFEPELLTEINLREPDNHLRYIQAYAQLEFQEGYMLGLTNKKELVVSLEETVDFFVHSIRTNKMENIITFYNESQKDPNKYNTITFFIFLHKANKALNRYGLK